MTADARRPAGEGGPSASSGGDRLDEDRTALIIEAATVPHRAEMASMEGLHPDTRAAVLAGIEATMTKVVALLIEAVES